MLRLLMLSFLVLLFLTGFCYGRDLISYDPVFVNTVEVLYSAYPRALLSTSQGLSMRHRRYSPLESPNSWKRRSSLAPAPAPASSPTYQGPAPSPSSASLIRHHRHHKRRHHAVSPAPSIISECDQMTCNEPLTSVPFGSPCGCVLPMKVGIHLTVASYAVFPMVAQLEIEVAAGIYLKQSQVRIMGASADVENVGSVVDLDLVPLGDKFDNTTALLIYERFWGKKVPVDKALFGEYNVMYVRYPGLPSSPPSGGSTGVSPDGAPEDPLMANFHGKRQKMNTRTIAIIVLSAVVFLLACVGAVFILLRCKRGRRPPNAVGPAFTSSITKRSSLGSIISTGMESPASGSLVSAMTACLLSVRTFSLAELEKATEKFSCKKILGEGGFGCVYHGVLEDGVEVAVKLLTREGQGGDREFIAEVEMLSRLHHRNLVKLIGVCVENNRRCLVYELVRNGSVESHLHGPEKRDKVLDWDARMKIALGAARGLAYLHEDSNPRVIHRDFKASNVLLEVDFTPKVSDFGLAREATEGSEHISTRVMGTFGYVAPEYAMTGHLLVKSDVYSYGVVLLELLTGRKPVDMSQPQGQENLVTWARPLLTTREGLEQLIDPGLTQNYDFNDVARIASIALMCVHPEVTQRPFMGEVVQALKLIYNDTNETCEQSASDHDSDFKGDLGPSNSWWDNGGSSPRLTYGYASSYVTMDYSSGPEEVDNNRLLSPFTFSSIGRDEMLPARQKSRSGPLRSTGKPAIFSRGSGSEPRELSRHNWNSRFWV
ncbi:Receptor-like serine/threonine-protein kinase ale2 [Ranunculus cassubicifolius]